MPVKKLVVIAGEESGDAHAARFIRDLKSTHPNLHISGIGGRHMQRAGVELVSNLAQYGVTGLTEILRHIKVIKKAFKDIKNHLAEQKPDLLVLVDYPGFNLRLAQYAKRELGIRILYYISPQIWAWKAGRIKKIRECVDHMAVIFPFEKIIYQNAHVPVSYVGHPLVASINQKLGRLLSHQELNLPQNKRIIALLPGSRTHEIERHMPVLVQSAEQLTQQCDDLHFVIPVAGTIAIDSIEHYLNHKKVSYSCIKEKAVEVAALSDCIVVASGTASLECALLEKPMCIIYKASTLTYLAASKLIKVKYLGLCNLLQNKMIVPELLQYDYNANELTKIVRQLLEDNACKSNLVKKLSQLKETLSQQQADCSISMLVDRELSHDTD